MNFLMPKDQEAAALDLCRKMRPSHVVDVHFRPCIIADASVGRVIRGDSLNYQKAIDNFVVCVSKNLVGRTIWKRFGRSNLLKTVNVIEGSCPMSPFSSGKNPHAHIVFEVPEKFELEDFNLAVKRASAGNKWFVRADQPGYLPLNIREVSNPVGAFEYLLKEGSGRFQMGEGFRNR